MNKPTKILILLGLCGFVLFFVMGNILFFSGLKPENEITNTNEKDTQNLVNLDNR